MQILKTRYNSTKTKLYACCPACVDAGREPDTKYHLYINPDKFAFCFRCGWKLPYWKLIQMYRIDTSGLKDELVQRPVSDFHKDVADNIQEFNTSVVSESAIGYLKKRKMSGKVAKRLNIKLGKNRLFGRVVFLDTKNNYYVARSFLPGLDPKTLNPVSSIRPLMYKDKDSYFTLYLVEGCFDLMPFIDTNKDAVAILGKDLSNEQMNALTKMKVNNIVIALDKDAFNDAIRLSKTISARVPLINIGVLTYEKGEGKDPGDMGVNLFDNTVVHWTRIIDDNWVVENI